MATWKSAQLYPTASNYTDIKAPPSTKPHRGLSPELAIIHYQMPTEWRISEGIGTAVIVSGHWDYTLWGGGG